MLFDFGGVLTTSVWDSFAAFCEAEGLDPDTVKRLFREDPEALAELRSLEMGEVDEAEFEASFGRRLGLSNHENLIDSMFAGMAPVTEMTDAVGRLRATGLRTGLVSNSWSTSHYDRELLAGLFDAVLISGELGMHKPEPEIYRLAAERVAAAPEACLFVDDLRENCEGAEAVGMTAVLHRGAETTLRELERLLGVELG